MKKNIIAMVFILAFMFAQPVYAAETVVSAPQGDEDFTFSQRIELTESTPFAGVQFELTVSDPDALELISFSVSGSDVSDAIAVAPVLKNGVYIFGFTTGSNAFSGNLDVGEVRFAYKGSEDAAFTLSKVKVAYFPEDEKTSAWLKEETDYITVNVTRGGNGNIPDLMIPLSGGLSWSLIALILGALGVAIAIYMGIRLLRGRNRDKITPIIVSVVLGAVGAVLFVVTQDMRGTMVVANIWTIGSAAILIAELLVLILVFRRKDVGATIAT